MKKSIFVAMIAVMALSLSSCCTAPKEESMSDLTNRVFAMAAEQCKLMDKQLNDSNSPRTFTPQGIFVPTTLSWWCSGFYPGTMWYIYKQTGDEQIKALADKHTRKLADVAACASGHDIGFQYWCSYGNGLLETDNKDYLPTLEEASAMLARRFNPTVGCIRSWGRVDDTNDFQVIIDNMMNLELLMEASRLFKCDSLANIANTHAKTTIANHYRDNNTCYHVLHYDQTNGQCVRKRTAQGYADESSWARGQAWGLYGFAMMYRETQDAAYLEMAEKIAKALMPRLPEDGMPYWDFDCPAIPYTYRDVSAGAIMASALVELSGETKDAAFAAECKAMAEKQIRSMASDKYMCTTAGKNGCFLLMHSVGNLHGTEKNTIQEVDAPLTYADYYFLEAILRYNAMYK